MKKTILALMLILSVAITKAQQSYNFKTAIEAIENDDNEKALDYLNREIKDNPENAGALIYRAVVHKVNENYSLALTDVNNALKYNKDKTSSAYIYNLKGKIYEDSKDYSNAIQSYSTAIKIEPNNKDYVIDRANLNFYLKNYESSDDDYNKIIAIDEGDVRGLGGLIRNNIVRKNYDIAETQLKKLMGLAPDYSYGYYLMSLYFDAKDEHDEALRSIYKSMILENVTGTYAAIFERNAAFNYPLALSLINKKLIESPNDDSWTYLKTNILVNKKDYKGAIEFIDKTINFNTSEYKISYISTKVNCYKELGRYTEAIAESTKLIESDSSDGTSYGIRGDIFRLNGDYKKAIADFDKAIELKPEEEWFYYRRGWIKDDNLHDINGALEDYNSAISINKNYAYTYLNRGRLYELKLNDKQKANYDYNKILQIDTTIDNQGNTRHYALFHLGKTEEAIKWMNKILEKYPEEGNYYDAACLYSLMNKPKESIEYLKISFEKGYRSIAHIKNDDDLDNIRKEPGYIALISKWENDIKNNNETKQPIKVEPKTTQTATIQMNPKGGGTYEITCKVNDLKLNFIFDTGASVISISQTEALFMLKNGYLNEKDITGKQSYMDANGNIEVGTTIILREVSFGGILLKNVTASVVNNKKAPLLFGQSALGKYAQILIDNSNNTLTITKQE